METLILALSETSIDGLVCAAKLNFPVTRLLHCMHLCTKGDSVLHM